MATKLKSNWLKLIVWILLFTYGLSGLCMLIVTGNQYVKSYFEQHSFKNEYYQFLDYLTLYHLNDVTEEETKKLITVSQEEIDEHRYRYGDLTTQIESIRSQYHNQIEEADAAGNEEAADHYRAERDAKIADITKNFEDDEHVKAKIIMEKEAEIEAYFISREAAREQHEKSFSNYQDDFVYYLRDRETGEIITNIGIGKEEPVEEYINEKTMLFIQSYPSRETGYLSAGNQGFAHVEYNETIAELAHSKTYEGLVAVPKSLPANSVIKMEMEDHQEERMIYLAFYGTSALALLLLWIFRKWAKESSPLDERMIAYYRRVPPDVRLLLLGVTVFFGMISFILFYNAFHHSEVIGIFFSFLLEFLLLFIFYFQIKWQIKIWQGIENMDEEWKGTLVFRLYNLLQEVFLKQNIGLQMIILLGGVFMLGLSAGAFLLGVSSMRFFIHPFFLFILFLCLVIGLISLISLLKNTGYFNKIVKNTEELAAGKMGADLPVKGKSVFATLAGNINVLKHGVKKSLSEQAKSERLKTELITNVSHDLRTPLTSIITYGELLKTPDLDEADRAAYIEVIDRKSKRLKVLIDDLFEASKMASGNIELNKEKVDLVQLLQQALAEHNEPLEKANLKLRVTTPEQPLYANVDGQKLWRVFDNLIGNILKYALENTRVFITLSMVGEKAEIAFKNVTKYELSENIDELFERFKRGDESRNTDGSGLGLAIAKSIVDLHEGEMDISVDGDLFKVIIKLDTMQ